MVPCQRQYHERQRLDNATPQSVSALTLQPAKRRKRLRRRWLTVGLVLLLTGGLFVALLQSRQTTRLEQQLLQAVDGQWINHDTAERYHFTLSGDIPLMTTQAETEIKTKTKTVQLELTDISLATRLISFRIVQAGEEWQMWQIKPDPQAPHRRLQLTGPDGSVSRLDAVFRL